CRYGLSHCEAWPRNRRSVVWPLACEPSGYSSTTGTSASKKTVRAAERTRPDIARKRARWRTHQASIDRRRLLFIDETWVKTNMPPLRGWGPRGQRLQADVPHGDWKTLTFIAALRHDRLDAP